MNFYINNLQNYVEEWQKPFCYSTPYLELVSSFVDLLRCTDDEIDYYKPIMLNKKRNFDLYCMKQTLKKAKPFRKKSKCRSRAKRSMAFKRSGTAQISNKTGRVSPRSSQPKIVRNSQNKQGSEFS